MRNTFFVPVRTSEAGTLALRTGRLVSGQRVGLAFTSETLLASTLGAAVQWVELDGQALKDMLAPLGVEQVRIDACPACAPDTPAARPELPERHPERLAPVRIRPRPADIARHAA
jgi:hypothetical protein